MKRAVVLFCAAALGWLGIRASAARTPWLDSQIQGSPEPAPPCAVERVFPRVEFREPVDFLWDSGTRRYWVLQLDGRLFSFEDSTTAQPELVADLGKLVTVSTNPVRQTLGFTLDPGFATNRFLYVCYVHTDGAPDGTQVSRFRVRDTPPLRLEEKSETPIISWRGGGHNGCSLKFGPDGFLYLSTGDSESPEPPDRLQTGQDIGDLLSSILRIDVRSSVTGKPYVIPADNPFRNRPGARPEVWAYGFRNPWRTSFGADGALWVGDVGWELWETIHRVTAGYNGGWSRVEGPQVLHPEWVAPTPISAPMIALPHSEAASITGGYVYRGRKLSAWRGDYVYGDWETGKIWALRSDGTRRVQNVELCDTTLRIIAFAPAADEELLVMDYKEGRGGAGIFRLIANPKTSDPARFPRRLSATGLFRDVAVQEPSAGVMEYRPVGSMWADFASSQRWVAVPGTNEITTDRGHPWSEVSWLFPSNAVLAKTLSLELRSGDPGSRRRIETQLLHYDGEAWQAYTYRWNDSQTDAELVPVAGASTTFRVQDPAAPGGVREQEWRFYSRAECFRCHNFWPGTALAFGWDSLGGKALSGDATNELSRLSTLGLLRETRAPERPVAKRVDPYDSEAPLDLRARSWLHLNCAHCHRNGAGGAVSAYFPADLPLEQLRIQGIRPLRGDFGLTNGSILAPGDPWRSVLLYRASTTGTGHMPTLGSRLPDTAGLGVLRDWIRTLPAGAAANSPRPDLDLDAEVQRLRSQPAGDARVKALRGGFASTRVALASLELARTDGEFRLDAVQATVRHPNPAVSGLYRVFVGREPQASMLGDVFEPDVVLRRTGDPNRGEAVFRSESGGNCVRCHVVDGVGGNFGPDLSVIASKYGPAELLEQIVRPSAVIAPEYALHVFETKSGETWSGVMVRRGSDEWVLRSETGDRVVHQSDLVRDEKSALSPMPEGLLSTLTAQEAADLVAYLRRSR